MPAPWKRRKIALAAACSVAAALSLAAGCDASRANSDRAVQAQMKTAGGGPEAVESLKTASQNNSASEGIRASAKLMLGQAEIAGAREKIRQIDRREVEIVRLLGEIRSVAGRIETNNQVAAAYKQLAEQAATTGKAEWEKLAAAAQGSGDSGVWVEGEAVKLPTLSAAQASLKGLQDQIGVLQGERGKLQDQQKAAEGKAADLFRQTDRTRGPEAVNLFTQAWQNQKAANDLAAQTTALDAKLARLQEQATLAQVQVKTLEATEAGLRQSGDAVATGAQGLLQRVEAINAESKALVSGPEPAAAMPAVTQPASPDGSTAAAPMAPEVGFGLPRVTLAGKATELAQLSNEVKAARAEVVTLVESAIQHFDEGLKLANGVANAAGPEIGLKEIFHPSTFNLQAANAHLILAALHQDAAGSLMARQSVLAYVQPVLKAAGTAVPEGLADASADKDAQQEREAAEKSYASAMELLEPIESSSGQGVARENSRNAYGAHAAALLGRSLLHRMNPAADSQKKADSDMTEATRLAKENADSAQMPPTLLLSLGMAPKLSMPATAPAATQPEGAAATEPATAPAETPAPAPAPDAAAPDAATPPTQ